MTAMELPFEAQRLLEAARLQRTPCGAGHIVWRLWGAGAPLFMLHGGAGSWTHWVRNIAAVVAAGRMACVPDLPGFGDSDLPPDGKDADAVVQPIADGIAVLCGDMPVDIVAFSFGSLVATLMAVRLRRRVSRLILVGAPVLPLSSGKGVTLKHWRHLPTQSERNEAHRFNLQAIMLHRPASIEGPALALQALNVPRDRMPGRKLVTTHAFRDALGQIECEFWVIYGEQDTLYKERWPEVLGMLDANALCRGAMLIPDAGHWVQFEEPDRFNSELQRVLGGAAGAVQ